MRYNALRSVTLLLAAVLAVVALGCKSKVGKLVGVSIQMPFEEAMGGHSDHMEYLGSVTVRLEDNTEVKAVCDRELLRTLRGGQLLVIEPLDNKGKWKVVRALH
ncbi:MAG: hypothetical protein ACLQGV_08805 [Bryobacteraceae bacterium]